MIATRPQDESSALPAGRAAMHRAEWATAAGLFQQELNEEETAEAHYALGQVLWFLNNLTSSLQHHRRAYSLYRTQGDPTAARIACWIAMEHLAIEGDISVARGWIARAERLVDGGEPSSGLGWFLLTQAALSGGAAMEQAARQVRDLGRRLPDPDLEICALSLLGQAIVYQGRVSEGMPLIEEAMAAVVAGELSDPTAIADCFCFMLATCEHAGDYQLAEEWVRTAAGYYAQATCPFLAGQCRTTYAGVLMAAGRWGEAETQLIGAIRTYESGHRGMRATVLARLAELRIRLGAFEEAEDLLEGMADLPAAMLPRALLYLSLGDPEGCIAVLDPVLPPGALQLGDTPRVGVAIDAFLAVARPKRAGEFVARLCDLAERSGSRVLQAEAKLAQGKVAAVTDPGRAAALFAEAAALSPYPDSPVTARIHLEHAKALEPTDPAGAAAQAGAALAGFRRMDAPREIDEALHLLRRLGRPTRLARAPGSTASLLSRREGEVLALVGAGLSNPQIAARLYLSRRTVEHHIGHIFAKLDLKSRSALVAYAFRSGARIAMGAEMGALTDVLPPPPGRDSS